MKTGQQIIRIAAILGALAVVFGAFGAHGLKALLSDQQLNAYQTGVEYHFYHALATVLVGVLCLIKHEKALIRVGVFFLLGIVLFSGSLYLLACADLLGISRGVKGILGPLTPIGGVFFILGWLQLAFAVK